MAVLKTHKGTKKRIKITGTGKIIRKFAGFGAHDRARKNSKFKRTRRKYYQITGKSAKKIVGYINL